MTTPENTFKKPNRKEGLSALCRLGPRVKCQFDNSQEFFAKKNEKSLFSWRVKGDFTLPLIPFATCLLASAVTLSLLVSEGKKKG